MTRVRTNCTEGVRGCSKQPLDFIDRLYLTFLLPCYFVLYNQGNVLNMLQTKTFSLSAILEHDVV